MPISSVRNWRKINAGDYMIRRNIPNILTLFRIALSCILNIYINLTLKDLFFPAIMCFFIILTDFFDGYIARRTSVTSRFGAFFDTFADLFFIILTYSVLCSQRILPLWFLFIIAFKFVEFILTSLLIVKYSNNNGILKFDFLGRIAATIFYIIPVYAYISFACSKAIYYRTIWILLLSGLIFALTSSFYRFFCCVKVIANQ